MADTTIETVQNAFHELKAEVKAGTLSPEKQEKLETVFNAYEDQNSKVAAMEQREAGQIAELAELKTAIAESATTQQEAKDRFDQLEVSLSKASETAKSDQYRETAEYKGLNEYCRNGMHNETLRTDVNVSGGFLVPSELDNVIVKKITELDAVRSIARVRTLAGKSLDIPKRTSTPIATFEGEAAAGGDSQSAYELQSLTPFRQTFSTLVTQDQVMNAAFNMEAEMSGDSAIAFAVGGGNGYVQGNGVKVPHGFMQDADVLANVRNSGDANEITFDGIVRLTGDLKVGYSPVFVMNRRTLASVRALVSTTGQPLWEPGINGGVAATLVGAPYVVLPSMADEGADAFPVAYGDFRAGYTIADRTGMSVIRNDVTFADQAIIKFTWNRWTTGDVVLPEAIRVLKCST